MNWLKEVDFNSPALQNDILAYQEAYQQKNFILQFGNGDRLSSANTTTTSSNIVVDLSLPSSIGAVNPGPSPTTSIQLNSIVADPPPTTTSIGADNPGPTPTTSIQPNSIVAGPPRNATRKRKSSAVADEIRKIWQYIQDDNLTKLKEMAGGENNIFESLILDLSADDNGNDV